MAIIAASKTALTIIKIFREEGIVSYMITQPEIMYHVTCSM